MPVSIDQWRGDTDFFINRIGSRFFFCWYDARISFKNLLSILIFLVIVVLFWLLLRLYFLVWIIFSAKLRPGISRHLTTSFFTCFISYTLQCSFLIFLGGAIKTNPGPISSTGQSFSICHWNLNSIAAKCC